MTLGNAGAPADTLTAIVVLFVALIGPSFVLLLAVQGRQVLRGRPRAGAAP